MSIPLRISTNEDGSLVLYRPTVQASQIQEIEDDLPEAESTQSSDQRDPSIRPQPQIQLEHVRILFRSHEHLQGLILGLYIVVIIVACLLGGASIVDLLRDFQII